MVFGDGMWFFRDTVRLIESIMRNVVRLLTLGLPHRFLCLGSQYIARRRSADVSQIAFITHAHADHIAELPLSLIQDINTKDEDDKITIFAPCASVDYLQKYIVAFHEANTCADYGTLGVQMNDFYKFVGLEAPRKTFRMQNNKDLLEVSTVAADHSVPTVVYGFSVVKQKLDPRFATLGGREIAELRKSGTSVTIETIERKFSYVLDTSIELFARDAWLLDYPVVIIECTFLMPDEREFARKKKHIHWEELKPLVLARPDTNFVLVHFTQRHSDTEIRAFFTRENVANIHPWLTDQVN